MAHMSRAHIPGRAARLGLIALSVALLIVGIASYGFFGSTGSTGTSAEAVQTSQLAPAPANLTQLPQPEVAPPVGDRGPKTVEYVLETKPVVAQLDDGVAYTYWTFDGTVPGPMLRVREGDTVRITLKNLPENTEVHNIDLHAVSGPGGGGMVTQVSPGHEATFEFLAQHPGTFVYHCAVAPAAMHIANGMFGLIVVEPAGGLPKVDREFYVMQSDMYIEGTKGQAGLHGMSMEKLAAETPDYVVFNGSVNSLNGENALQAKTGEKIRIFFGDGGPNLTSSFHVIGQVFDRVAIEGGSEWATNVQTAMVPAGGATIAEFTATVPGDYTIVDHSLSRASKGATATIHVEGPDNPAVFKVIQPGNVQSGGGH